MLALNAALLFVVRQQSFLMYNRLHSTSVNSANDSYTGNPPANQLKIQARALSRCKQRLSSTFSAPITSKTCKNPVKKASLIIIVNSGTATSNEPETGNFGIVSKIGSLNSVITSHPNNPSSGQNQNIFRRSIDQAIFNFIQYNF